MVSQKGEPRQLTVERAHCVCRAENSRSLQRSQNGTHHPVQKKLQKVLTIHRQTGEQSKPITTWKKATEIVENKWFENSFVAPYHILFSVHTDSAFHFLCEPRGVGF